MHVSLGLTAGSKPILSCVLDSKNRDRAIGVPVLGGFCVSVCGGVCREGS